MVRVLPPGGWTWNNNVDKPTFAPSVLVTSGHYVPDFGTPGRDRCWCTYNAEHPHEPTTFHCERCHSYVTDGKIQFLGDCTHNLVNQTVDLPPWPTSEGYADF